MSDEEKQVFKINDKCSIEFTKLGNVNIIGDCNGEEVNRTEIAIFNKVATLFENENKK